MDENTKFENLFNRLGHSAFRSSFHLKPSDIDYVNKKGLDIIENHARDFVVNRLAPANPTKDGKQTPWKGHPVFIAQHATATCCRSCLEKWHKIKKNTKLNENQINYIIEVIMKFIERELQSNSLKL